jgi:hypothetical protein
VVAQAGLSAPIGTGSRVRVRSLFVLVLGLALVAPAAQAKTKKLIEMGWDEPDPGFMRAHLAQLEASPFDGCIYHLTYRDPGHPPGNFTWDVWGTRTFTEADVDSGLRDLVATPFRRFRWNFLRVNVTPASIDWFDDFAPVLSNVRLAASVARRGGSAGVMLDVEAYQGPVFEYRALRDTARHDFAAYAAQARRRGAEVMRAFEQGYPGLIVFLTAGPSLPYVVWLGDHTPIEAQRYGLLTAFVDGMVSAASDSARIVDGCEGSYPAREPRVIDDYYRAQTHGVLAWVADSSRYRRLVSRSFGIWMDHDWSHRGWNVFHADLNYRTPAALQAVVRRALELADDFVWIYSETPRWWSESGTPQKLPPAFDRAVRQARRGLAP